MRHEGKVLGLEAGQLYIPFGEFYSYFVTGPILEFGATRGYALVADYELSDAIDVFAYGLNSKAGKSGASGGKVDRGADLNMLRKTSL